MPRTLKVAAAQVGAVGLSADRGETLRRMLTLLGEAASHGAQLVVFPETTFTTFFPRHLFHDQVKLDEFFEHNEDITQSLNVKPLFDEAYTLGVDIAVGYAERTPDGKGFNTAVYYSSLSGMVLKKYRKIHLPGTVEPFENPDAVNQLEKRYFEPGNLGFEAFRAPGLVKDSLKAGTTAGDAKAMAGKGDPILGMLICNDRRWPEGWRCLGLQGVELVMCGYNTAGWAPDLWGMRKPMTLEQAEAEALFSHRLVMQANSYMNACFSISSARCGADDGKYDLIAGSAIVGPDGHIIAESKTKGDEVIVAEIDLEDCRQGKEKTFDFDRHRRIETYGRITQQTGVVEPPLLQAEITNGIKS
ncbi:MAG: Carbon-nitrogen hydrolase [Lasallia pustulata]|uniref:Carbon-nitrogen hydrolase n=1 Tax=Lasallia pustulata TaxID=136370 RepID=A0A5M8PUN1_9LECA|nr:MAG: Carbon-nitrogen hydrolase [Lasallia pustulata]